MKKRTKEETTILRAVRITFGIWILLLAFCATSYTLIGTIYGFSTLGMDALSLALALVGGFAVALSIPVICVFVSSARLLYLDESQSLDTMLGYCCGLWLILLPETLWAVIKGKFK